jgi:hypothetical protein
VGFRAVFEITGVDDMVGRKQENCTLCVWPCRDQFLCKTATVRMESGAGYEKVFDDTDDDERDLGHGRRVRFAKGRRVVSLH